MTFDEFVCYNRALLVRLCKRHKLRGYTKLKKCDLVVALTEFFDNPDDYPLERGRKTIDLGRMLDNVDARPRVGKNVKPIKKGKRGKKGKKNLKRTAYKSVYKSAKKKVDESDSDTESVSSSQLSNHPFIYSE